MISAYPGFGKTAGAINLATSIKFKTLIIVNKIVLIKQWKESILKFCPTAKVQTLTAQSKKQDVDFYIINAQNTEKMGKTFFADIGTCVVDEAHMIMAETLSKSLQYVYPRYLIGLTATPYRPDGLDVLLNFYFGNHKIIRKLHREHTAYKVSTGFKPPVEKTIQGRINWGSILDAQANNDERNDLIIRIIQHFSDRNFLVLVKRVEQGKYLVNSLKKYGESVTDLIGSNQDFDTEARILVGTCQKVGVGFDHSKLDTLLLATDLEEYFVQYLGRIFRTKDNTPIVFDLVDENSILNKHFNTRRKVYQEHGGIVKDFDLSTIE
jgi:superfamily II DNA or RNA helicase